MAISTITDVIEEVESLQATYELASQRLAALEPTRTNLGTVAETLGVMLTAARGLADELATVAELGLVSVPDGQRTIEVWSWRRKTRFQTMYLVSQGQQLLDLVVELLEGLAVKVVTIRDGDTLQDIAARELGDWQEWPRLVEANPDVDIQPANLVPGTRLVIPTEA